MRLKDSNVKELAEKSVMKAGLYFELRNYWNEYVLENQVGNSRERENVIHRHAFCVVARRYAPISLKFIGGVLGRDHATVLHASKNHETNYRFDSEYRAIYHRMEADIIDIVTESGIPPREVDAPNTANEEIQQLRKKNMNLMGRMRKMILKHKKEIKGVRDEMEHYEYLKKYNQELVDRNRQLHSELKRIKNLL